MIKIWVVQRGGWSYIVSQRTVAMNMFPGIRRLEQFETEAEARLYCESLNAMLRFNQLLRSLHTPATPNQFFFFLITIIQESFMSHLSRNEQHILKLLNQYDRLTITQIRERLGLGTLPYNEISLLQNSGCIQQSQDKETVSYKITSGGNFVLSEYQAQLEKI